jgi:hypothetical protein
MSAILLSYNNWTLELSEQGHILGLRHNGTEIAPGSSDKSLCEVFFVDSGKTVSVTSATLVGRNALSADFEAVVDKTAGLGVHVRYEVTGSNITELAVKCMVGLFSERRPDTDVELRWFLRLHVSAGRPSLFAPLFDGRGLRTSRSEQSQYHYICSGNWGEGESERLAVPVVDESSPDLRFHMSYFADPFFSTGMILPADQSYVLFRSGFLHAAGAQQLQQRIFGFYLHSGDADTALQGFFRHGLPDSPPGPSWLQEIAMVHYDYLSERGEGWFRDIDRLVELVSMDDRRRIALTLHGWYDFLGRYSFDEEKGRFDSRWVTMPTGEKVPMTIEDMHRRIDYARERGFRVLLYFADGLAVDSGASNFSDDLLFRETNGEPRKHHWSGPDTIAQTFIMDPLHPRVRSFFLNYMRALLDEFGDTIDGLNWDETFTIRAGELSIGKYSGYADRAFMLLCKELRELVKARNPTIAFLGSDCTGLTLPLEDGSFWSAEPAQNALVFDGTYQDSHCYPTAWQYGIFPNYRNVLWSCNWKPLTNFEWTRMGVQAFGAPVAISNGWEDNRGISAYSELETKKTMDLFKFRKTQRSRLRWMESRSAG